MKLRVNLKKIGKRQSFVHEAVYEVPGHPGTVRELIEAMTEAGVKQYNRRMEESELLRCLTREEIEDRAAAGKVGFGVNYGEKKADLVQAAANAVQSFEDGIYRIFLGDRPLQDLDEEIQLTEDSSLTFVRLTMLTGRLW